MFIIGWHISFTLLILCIIYDLLRVPSTYIYTDWIHLSLTHTLSLYINI